MTILSKTVKRGSKVINNFLGVYIPEELFIYHTMYCTCFGVTKSNVIKSILNKWYRNSIKLYSEEYLVKGIAKKALERWNNPKGNRLKYSTWRSLLKEEFLGNKIPEDTVNQILEIVDYGKNEKG